MIFGYIKMYKWLHLSALCCVRINADCIYNMYGPWTPRYVRNALIYVSFIHEIVMAPSVILVCFSSLNNPICPRPHLWDSSITHSDTTHSISLLWRSDQLVALTSTWQHTTLTKDKHSCSRQDSNPQCQLASCRRFTPRTASPRGSTCLLLNRLIIV